MLKLISHRGNINGKDVKRENHPSYIDDAILKGYDVEIDIWYDNIDLYLGHVYPQYKIDICWLYKRISSIWIHCKNHESIHYLYDTNFNYFWHNEDDITITSKGFIWSHPKIKPIHNSISVLPEINGYDTSMCLGICSDYVELYKKNE